MDITLSPPPDFPMSNEFVEDPMDQSIQIGDEEEVQEVDMLGGDDEDLDVDLMADEMEDDTFDSSNEEIVEEVEIFSDAPSSQSVNVVDDEPGALIMDSSHSLPAAGLSVLPPSPSLAFPPIEEAILIVEDAPEEEANVPSEETVAPPEPTSPQTSTKQLVQPTVEVETNQTEDVIDLSQLESEPECDPEISEVHHEEAVEATSPPTVIYSEHEIFTSSSEDGHHFEDDDDDDEEEDDEDDASDNFFFPTVISYQPSSSTSTCSTKSYALFHPVPSLSAESKKEDPSDLPLLPVLLSSNPNLFDAPLLELFDALREEAAFSIDEKVLDVDDGAGTKEWLLAHENEKVGIIIGEDNVWASQTSLSDLARLHHEYCDLPPPLRLTLQVGQPRFMLRFQKIQAIRQEMDEENEDSEEDTEIEHDDKHEEEDEEAALDHETETDAKDEILTTEAVVRIEDEDELASNPDETIEPSTEEEIHTEDQFDNPDELSAEVDQFAGAQSVYDNEQDELVIESTNVPEESEIVEDTKIVVTANADIEVPLGANHVETVNGDFDESEAIKQIGVDEFEENEFITENDPAEDLDEVDTADRSLAREVEIEAALKTSSEGAVEKVPVPPQFVFEAKLTEEIAEPETELKEDGEPSPLVVPTILEPESSTTLKPELKNPNTRLQSSHPTFSPFLEHRNSLSTDVTFNDLYAESPLLSPTGEESPITDLEAIDHELSEAESDLLIIQNESEAEGVRNEKGSPKRRHKDLGEEDEVLVVGEDTERDPKRLRAD